MTNCTALDEANKRIAELYADLMKERNEHAYWHKAYCEGLTVLNEKREDEEAAQKNAKEWKDAYCEAYQECEKWKTRYEVILHANGEKGREIERLKAELTAYTTFKIETQHATVVPTQRPRTRPRKRTVSKMPEQLSEHFQAGEFTCHCCGQGAPTPALVELLEAIRAAANVLKIGATVHVNCGYRCPKHNKAVGGEPKSYHCGDYYGMIHVGLAADIVIPGLTPRQVAAIAEGCEGIGGIGIYKTFTHVDVGPAGRRWKG